MPRMCKNNEQAFLQSCFGTFEIWAVRPSARTLVAKATEKTTKWSVRAEAWLISHDFNYYTHLQEKLQVFYSGRINPNSFIFARNSSFVRLHSCRASWRDIRFLDTKWQYVSTCPSWRPSSRPISLIISSYFS